MSVSNLKSCQIACLMDANCRTATFDQSMNQCELFANISSGNGSMIAQAGVVTLTVIDRTPKSALATTTSTTTSTTTVTTAITTTTITTSTTTACLTPATTTTVTAIALPSECSNYTLITDGTRNANYTGGNGCDQTGSFASAAWYAFSGAAGTMLASCVVPSYQCGTSGTGWYSGAYPSAAGSTTSGTVCYNWGGNNCDLSNSISVTNCNGYYVFYLPPTPICSFRYCTV